MGRIHHIPSQVHVDSDSWVPILQAREEEKDRRNDKSQGGEGDWRSVTLPQLYEIGHERRLDISIILGSLCQVTKITEVKNLCLLSLMSITGNKHDNKKN